ncbi:MAG: hypothetical protein AAF604_17220 [Acidobacteriota bacterium]
MRFSRPPLFCWLPTLCWLTVLPLSAELPISVVLREGSIIDGDAVVFRLEDPKVNQAGEVGFFGIAQRGSLSDRFVWIDDGPVWFNSLGPGGFTSGEGAFGIGDGGQFVYPPTIDGQAALWTDRGLLAEAGAAAPGLPDATLVGFSFLEMTANDRIFWAAWVDPEGPASRDRALYRSTGPGAPVDLLVNGAEPIDGTTIIRFIDLDASNGGDHYAAIALTDSGSVDTDLILILDGAFAGREGELVTTTGESWERFQLVAVNDRGNLAVSGELAGPEDRDDVISLDNHIVLREGDAIADRVLTAPALIKGLALDNRGRMLHAWRSNGVETLYLAQDAGDPANTSTALLSVGDRIDTDGDGAVDGAVTEFNFNWTTFRRLDLAEGDNVCVEVDLEGGNDDEAVLCIDVSSLGSSAAVLEIPTLSGAGLAALLGLVTLAGIGLLRRRAS